MDDKLSFLDDTETEEPAVEVVEAAEPVAEPEPKGETVSAPPAEEEKAPREIPITALLDERERRQKAEREAEELRRWKQQIEAQRAAPKAPDFYENPDDRLQYERQQFQAQLTAMKLQQSRFLAVKDFGEEEVNSAYAFFDENPALSQRLLDHPSPFHAAVEVYRRERLTSEIGTDPEGWKAKQLEALREQVRAEILAGSQPAAPARPRPPVSLATAPAAGSRNETAPKGSAFDAAFPD